MLRWRGRPLSGSKWIAHPDEDNQLWLLDTTTKTQKKIDLADFGDNSDPPVQRRPLGLRTAAVRSPTTGRASGFEQIILYNIEKAPPRLLTTGLLQQSRRLLEPRWQVDLFALSDRSWKSVVGAPWGPRQPDPFFDRPA